jgi:hypothetical protein
VFFAAGMKDFPAQTCPANKLWTRLLHLMD